MDKKTFEHRALQLRPQLIKIGVAFFGNNDEAEDVAQEALIKLFVLWDRLSEDDNLQALANKIATNYCISHKRQRKKTEAISYAPDVEDVSTDLEQKEGLSQIQIAISHLTKGEQRIWRMWQDGEMDAKQIASVANIDIRSVSSILSRSRKKIFEELKKKGNL